MLTAIVGSVIGIILGAGSVLIPFWMSQNDYQKEIKEHGKMNVNF